MAYAKLETATLAHVDDTYFYGAYCRKCTHAARLSLEKLRQYLGDNVPLREIKDRLRCERCSSRQIVITFLAPNQRTGNVVHLFRRMLRKSIDWDRPVQDFGAPVPYRWGSLRHMPMPRRALHCFRRSSDATRVPDAKSPLCRLI
jgi:hypothetical protein